MWTHLQPYLEDDFTSNTIERTARVSLYRALNLRRLIVFTGSGTSRAYCHPSWDELATIFLQETAQQYSQATDAEPKRSGFRTSGLRAQIWELLDPKGWEELNPKNREKKKFPPIDLERIAQVDKNALFTLCENILERLPPDQQIGHSRLWIARRNFAARFRGNEAALTKLVLENTFAIKPKNDGLYDFSDIEGLRSLYIGNRNAYERLMQSVELDDTNREISNEGCCLSDQLLKIARGDLEPDDAHAGLMLPAWPRKSGFGPELRGRSARDPIHCLIDKLGVRRFLTLNYDVQLERHVYHKLNKHQSPKAHSFAALCGESVTKRPDPKRVTIESGAGRFVVSATLQSNNIREIINYAALSQVYDQQFFHLHGRLDDPDNLVLTSRDYRRVYEKDGATRQVFEEAQEVLFGGNDVLFIGIGMGEQDILRPFRKFMSIDDQSGHKSRRAFALMPSHYGDHWKRKNDARTISYAAQYNILILHFGGQVFRELLSTLSDAENELRELLIQSSGELSIPDSNELLETLTKKLSECHSIPSELHYPDTRPGARILSGYWLM